MEYQTPTQQSSNISQKIITPQPKPNYLKIVLFSVLLIMTLGLITYLFFQNQKLQKQVLNPPVSPAVETPTSTKKPVSSISTPPDKTAEWKTYTNTTYNFSFKYPDTWKYYEGVGIYFGDSGIMDSSHYKISLNIDNKDYLTLKNIFTTSSNDLRLININGTEGLTHSVISMVSKKNYKLPSDFTGDIILMDAYESKVTNYEALIPLKGKTLRIYSGIETKDVVSQILSTFKFINAN